MSQTILITGASSGIGLATALLFQQRGWHVAATMRQPDGADALTESATLKRYRLDVVDEASIQTAVAQIQKDFGNIDVVLNNAGYGAVGPFEAATGEQIEKQFNTNVFGLMAVIRAVLPQMRAQRSGVIINVSSVGGRVALPLNSLYHGTKFALEGFTESLYYELDPLGIRVKLIEPGGVRTNFINAVEILHNPELSDYTPLVEKTVQAFASRRENYAPPEACAEVIYTAATDGIKQLRYVSGEDAEQLIAAHESMTQEQYYAMVQSRFFGASQ